MQNPTRVRDPPHHYSYPLSPNDASHADNDGKRKRYNEHVIHTVTVSAQLLKEGAAVVGTPLKWPSYLHFPSPHLLVT